MAAHRSVRAAAAAMFVALHLLCGQSWTVLAQQQQFGCYTQFSSQHSGCLTGSRCRSKVLSGVSAQEQEHIVFLHNEIRSQVASGTASISLHGGSISIPLPFYFPTASNMMEMVWDPELAFIAQKWADQCSKTTDCGQPCRQVARFSVGQSFSWREIRPDDGSRADWTTVIKDWATEGARSITSGVVLSYPGSNGNWGRLTQILWATTQYIGCGFSKDSIGGSALFIYVCNYGPGGNVIGLPTFQTGSPCTACPQTSTMCERNSLCGSGSGAMTMTFPSDEIDVGDDVQSQMNPQQPSFLKTVAPSMNFCTKDCLFISECDSATVDLTANCGDQKVCCNRGVPVRWPSAPPDSPWTVLRSGLPMTAMTSTTAATTTVTKCPYACVRLQLQNWCDQQTIYLGVTDCSTQEICCLPKMAARTTPAPVVPECSGELACVPNEAIMQMCNMAGFVSDRTIHSRKCPDGSTCCQPTKPPASGCPATHACLPPELSQMCGQDVIKSAGLCPGNKICCQLKMGSSPEPEIASRQLPFVTLPSSPCAYSCVSGDDADFCVSLGAAMNGSCPAGSVCCQGIGERVPLSVTTTQAPTTTPARLNCEGYGRCLAGYLTAECRGRSGDSEFSSAFVCSNPRLLCCVKKEVLAKLASQKGNTLKSVPKSPISGTSCGQTARSTSLFQGKPASAWCWVVEIVDSQDTLLCYGSLIEVQFVTTVASCVLADGVDLNKNIFMKFPWRTEKNPIAQRIAHFAFAPETVDNDISVIRLRQPVDLKTSGACLICLPPEPDMSVKNPKLLVPPSVAEVDHSGQRRGNVVEIGASLSSTTVCSSSSGVEMLSSSYSQLPANSFCVSSDGAACPTKGTPLVATDPNGFYLLGGHFSFSKSCSTAGSVSVFTSARSKSALDFIKTSLAAMSSVEMSGPAAPVQDSAASAVTSATDTGTFCRALAPVNHGSFRIVGCDGGLSAGLVAIDLGNRTDCLVDNIQYLPGTRVKYQCDQFYRTVGQEWRSCGKNGEWSSPQPPYCEPVCGRKISTTALATKGTKSKAGEWPWIAGLYDVNDDVIACGGALIKESWVMTAAHCVTTLTDVVLPPERFRVYVGKVYRSFAKDDEYVQNIEVTAVISHPRFNRRNMDSDIAVLRLKKPAVLSHRVQLVCLPERFDVSESNREPGSIGTVAGWGSTEKEVLASQLQHIKLPVVSTKVCREETIATSNDAGATRSLNGNMFCAGYGMMTPPEEFRTVCPGDSGGPLVFQQRGSVDDTWVVEGIVSFYMNSHTECKNLGPGVFSVFTSVFAYRDWIAANAV